MEHFYESLPNRTEWDREFEPYDRNTRLVGFTLRGRASKLLVEIWAALYDPLAEEDPRWHPGVCLCTRPGLGELYEGALLWVDVPYMNFRADGRFDTRAFVAEMTSKTLEAVDLVPVVEEILRGLK